MKYNTFCSDGCGDQRVRRRY